MKTKLLSSVLSIVLLVVLITAAIVFNIGKPRLMVLHSYNTDYSWTRDVNVGLMRVLEKRPNYSLVWHYMDTKKHKDKGALLRAGLIARQAIDKWEPDVLIAVDNLAQDLAARYYVNHPRINIIFAGINGSIEPYGYHKANNVTGILENRQCKALQELILSVEKARAENKPDHLQKPVRLRYLLDSSQSVLGDKAHIENFNWQPLVYVGAFVAGNYAQWQREVLESSGKTDYLFVTNYRQLPRSESDPQFVPPREVMGWTENHSPVPVIGLNPFNVEDGGMISVGVSPYEQGEVAAVMAEDIIENDTRPGDIPVVPNRHFIIAMRKSAVLKRGVRFPDIYEAFSRATNSYFD